MTARSKFHIIIQHMLPHCHRLIEFPITAELRFRDPQVCYLFGIQEPDQLRRHPLRGAIFESWAVAELYKIHLPQRIKCTRLPPVIKNHVVYGGEESQQRYRRNW
ncbi:MAG: hypothetical protein BMS9Abin08_0736 [Gammaproteobacteria bacterium]|nr:MAG: hypothetical protein BMS9Abin08_0736 [Gammaproteobacteria bacterium]